MPSLVSLLEPLSNSRAIVVIRDSSFGMPAIQSIHLVGLTVLLAVMLVLNLRLAGLSLTHWSLPSIERHAPRPLEATPWLRNQMHSTESLKHRNTESIFENHDSLVLCFRASV